MKKHSEPSLYGFIILMTILFVLVDLVAKSLTAFVLPYLLTGILVYFPVAGADTSFLRTLFLWYPAILLDKPEWFFNEEI